MGVGSDRKESQRVHSAPTADRSRKKTRTTCVLKFVCRSQTKIQARDKTRGLDEEQTNPMG